MLREGRSFSGKERNCVFLNTLSSDSAGGQFATISAVSGADFPEDGRAVVHIDWDQDGDLDLWFSNRNEPRLRFLRNDSQSDNQFVQLKLVGNGTDTNLNAVGASIRLTTRAVDGGPDNDSTTPHQQMREIRAGDAFISQGTLVAHFGIGKNVEVDRVEVRWPNRESTVEVFDGVDAGGRFQLVQGTGHATPINAPQEASVLKPSVLKPTVPTLKQRIPLISRFSAPPITYKGLDGKSTTVSPDKNQVTVLNLWSTTCGPCLSELGEFSERYSELQQNNIRVVALCIDELNDSPLEPGSGDPVALTRAVVERLEMPFDAGMASPELVSQIQRLHDSLIESIRPMPLPTSILIDRDGRLDVIYKGTVSVDQLIADSKPLSDQSVAARFARSAMLPGKLLRDPSAMEIVDNTTAQAHIKLARELMDGNHIDEAVKVYEQGLQALGDSAFMLNELATLLASQGKYTRAIPIFRKSLALEPGNAQHRINLAQSLLAVKQLASAEKELKRTTKDSPKNADAHFYLGVVQGRQKKPKLARQSFEAAVRCNPDHARAHFSLGAHFLQQREYNRARQALENALRVEPQEVVVLTNLANVLLHLDLPDLAEARVREAIQIQPEFADAHYQLGVIQLYRGDRPSARVTFTEALRLQPGHADTLRAMRDLN